MNYFLLPVLNEANISTTVRAILEYCESSNVDFRIVIIDDGSMPKMVTIIDSDILSNPNVEVVEHEHNHGPGRAFRTAFERLPLTLSPKDVVVSLEGDGTSNVTLLPRLIEILNCESRQIDIAIASPYATGGSILNSNKWRKVISWAGNKVFRFLFSLTDIKTLSCFYRAFSGNAINNLRAAYGKGIIDSDGFECMVEILWKARRLSLEIYETPFIVDNGLREGRSNMKVFRTLFGYLRLLLRVKFVWKHE